jgi:predicted nucleic acid-binding protein
MVRTDEVLAEFLTFFSNSLRLRGSAVETVRQLTRDPNLRILPQSRETFQAGFDLYAARPDKGYSLTDCISMQTMKRLGLTDVLTNDRHFEQEGFKALLRL